MPKLIPNNNYLLTVDNMGAPKKIRRVLNGHCRFIKRKDSKLMFTNGELTFTLWNDPLHRARHLFDNRGCEFYTCYATLEKNNNYRITKYQLNSNSIYLWVNISTIEPNYLQLSSCHIATLRKFLLLVEFYNKAVIKKNQKKTPAITKIFQDYYITRYISEFL